MQQETEAGLPETGLGRFQGTGDNDLTARRMASLTVRRKCNTHACTKPQTGACGHERHADDVRAMTDILAMLGLPPEVYDPTPQERAELFEHLPRHIAMDMRSTDNMLTPENRLPTRF